MTCRLRVLALSYMAPDTTRIYDPELKRLRAIKMLEAKVMQSRSNAQIAEQFNVSEHTVIRTLDWAKRAGLVANYEDQILSALVPAAIAAFAEALENGDTQVALEVLKGTGLLKKQTDKPLVPAQAANEDDLAGYIRRIRGGTDAAKLTTRPIAELVAAPDDAGGPLTPSGTRGVVDGDILEDPGDPDTPTPPAPVQPDGSEDRAPDDAGQVELPADADGSADESALDVCGPEARRPAASL